MRGPANTCNVARFTQVPVPPFALAQLLRGEAPVLVHEASGVDHRVGGWRVRRAHQQQALCDRGDPPRAHPERLESPVERADAFEFCRFASRSSDMDLYRAFLADHEAASTAKPIKDPDGLDPTIPPSGPECRAEIPRRLRLETPDTDQELVLRNKEVNHNPPLLPGVFRQDPPRGVSLREARCAD